MFPNISFDFSSALVWREFIRKLDFIPKGYKFRFCNSGYLKYESAYYQLHLETRIYHWINSSRFCLTEIQSHLFLISFLLPFSFLGFYPRSLFYEWDPRFIVFVFTPMEWVLNNDNKKTTKVTKIEHKNIRFGEDSDVWNPLKLLQMTILSLSLIRRSIYYYNRYFNLKAS